MRIACATDDNSYLIKDHFGDAKYYDIYDVSEQGISFVKSVENNIESNVHPDPSKGVKITNLLKNENVDILVNRTFGTNIKIVKKHLIPLIIRGEKITESLQKIQDNIKYITELANTKSDLYIVINEESEVHVIETT